MVLGKEKGNTHERSLHALGQHRQDRHDSHCLESSLKVPAETRSARRNYMRMMITCHLHSAMYLHAPLSLRKATSSTLVDILATERPNTQRTLTSRKK